MKVFISWSGERSNALAEALRNWIPLVLHYADPWLSHADIEAGQRWAEQVAKELESCNFGVLAITRENVGSPWVLFEAGALAKSMQGSRVIPLLLDLEIRDIAGPLAQFQAKKVDRTGVLEVIQSLNQAANQPAPEDRVEQLFNALWPELERKVAEIPKGAPQAKHTRPQNDILEELVTSVRSLDSRLREVWEEGPRMARARSRRFHPAMLHEMNHMLGGKRGDPIVLLMLASLFRDDLPWMYELGVEAYRAAKAGSPEEAMAARKKFVRAAQVMRHGPFLAEELGMDPRMLHMMVRELDHLLGPEAEVEIEEPETDASSPSQAKPKRKKAEKG